MDRAILPSALEFVKTDDSIAVSECHAFAKLHWRHGQHHDATRLGNQPERHGIVYFDYDEDGDQDIYSSLGGMWPGDNWPNQFFENQSQLTNRWVKLVFCGRQSNYHGVGAMIRVQARSEDGEEIIRYYYMNNKTGFGSAPYLAHVGLMNASTIEQIEVIWPTSRTTKKYSARIGKLTVLDEDGSSREVPVGEAW